MGWGRVPVWVAGLTGAGAHVIGRDQVQGLAVQAVLKPGVEPLDQVVPRLQFRRYVPLKDLLQALREPFLVAVPAAHEVLTKGLAGSTEAEEVRFGV